MGVWQRGQREPGETMDWPSGMREMHTLRKLPMMIPKMKKKKRTTDLTVPQSTVGLKKRRVGRVGWLTRLVQKSRRFWLFCRS